MDYSLLDSLIQDNRYCMTNVTPKERASRYYMGICKFCLGEEGFIFFMGNYNIESEALFSNYSLFRESPPGRLEDLLEVFSGDLIDLPRYLGQHEAIDTVIQSRLEKGI